MKSFHACTVVLATLIAGCGSDSKDHEEEKKPLAFVGTYTADPGQANAPFAQISFLSADHYELRSRGCEAADCAELGTYRIDEAARQLTLVSDDGQTKTLPFTVTGSRSGPPQAALTSSSLHPRLVIPPKEDQPDSSGALTSETTTTLLSDTPVQLVISAQIGDGAFTGGAPPRRSHLFVVRSKGFIAPISNDRIGSVGGTIADAALYAFAKATNLNFSENPTNGSSSSGQFRLWAQVFLDVTCDGSAASLKLTDPDTDAGYEGPLKAETDPLKTDFYPTGAFAYQAQGRPASAAEPAFQAVHARTNSTIWYKVQGRVICNDYGGATLHFDAVTTTKFPSFRLWVTQLSDGRDGKEALIVDRGQGNFSELWSLPAAPAF